MHTTCIPSMCIQDNIKQLTRHLPLCLSSTTPENISMSLIEGIFCLFRCVLNPPVWSIGIMLEIWWHDIRLWWPIQLLVTIKAVSVAASLWLFIKCNFICCRVPGNSTVIWVGGGDWRTRRLHILGWIYFYCPSASVYPDQIYKHWMNPYESPNVGWVKIFSWYN